MTESPPTIFGQPMHLQALPGKPMYVLSLDGDYMWISVWQRDSGEWVSRVEGASRCFISSTHRGASDAARAVEKRIEELVEMLAPLMGWQPPEKKP